VATKNDASVIQGLVSEVLSAKVPPRTALSDELRRASDDVQALATVDYGGPLRKCLGRDELNQLVAEAKKNVWPHLNRESLRLASPKEFAKSWSNLGIDIRPAKMTSANGMALLGFYVKKTKVLSGRPLICVNTAHHPAAVGAAFVHEMGHHLTSNMFGSQEEAASFLLYTGYAQHLNDPAELIPDILVSLGIYPQPMARRIFGENSRRKGESPVDESQRERLLKYFSTQYALTFDRKLPYDKQLQYMAGVLHYTRLRAALHQEFDI
jgi:hypothetical protein